MSGLQSAHRAFIAFDLYGTLLSTESIARELGKVVGDHDQAKSIAASWRRYQLEYTWRLNSMGESVRTLFCFRCRTILART